MISWSSVPLAIDPMTWRPGSRKWKRQSSCCDLTHGKPLMTDLTWLDTWLHMTSRDSIACCCIVSNLQPPVALVFTPCDAGPPPKISGNFLNLRMIEVSLGKSQEMVFGILGKRLFAHPQTSGFANLYDLFRWTFPRDSWYVIFFALLPIACMHLIVLSLAS